MAKTYTAAATGIVFASNKSMLAMINAHATRKVKIYRVIILNNQTVGVTGVLTTMNMRKINSLSGGSAITPVAHDTSNTTVDLTSITTSTGGTASATADSPWRTWMWSSDEPAVSAATSDELQCIIPLMTIWDSTGDSNIEPITLNQNEGITINHTQATTAGGALCDIFIEFTVS